jgi:RNA polymerase sigma-70 factor (ECF subfamily)
MPKTSCKTVFLTGGSPTRPLLTPAAWLTTVVRHRSIDRLRQRARDALAAHTALDLVSATAPPLPEDELLLRADLGEALGRLLAHLSAAERLAIVLHDVFDCDHAGIAAVLGTTAVNSRQYLARARRRLREAEAAAAATPAETLCRDLVRRFQAAINGRDLPAMLSLLAGEQPVSVRAAARLPPVGACANDLAYVPARARLRA